MSDTYTLKIACRNCGHSWDQDIPKGMAWQDALNQSDWDELRIPAAFGLHCGSHHQGYRDETSAGNFCKNCSFTEVYCPNCLSLNVAKAPKGDNDMSKSKRFLLANLLASPEKIAEDDECYNLLTKLYDRVSELRLQWQVRDMTKKATKSCPT